MLNRREFLIGGAAGVLSGCRLGGNAAHVKDQPVVRFGMVTDLHYADLDSDAKPLGVAGRRFYRESVRKLDEAINVFNARGLDFAIELGDFKDFTRNKADTLAHLKTIEACFAKFDGPRYHVAGNHDFDCLTPSEFFGALTNDGTAWQRGYYAFSRNGIRFIVLDACYDASYNHYACNNPWADANVPPEELAWLKQELADSEDPVVVFIHQRLDAQAHAGHRVRNAEAVCQLLEASCKVKSVFCGHQHKGGIATHNGITYYGLRALVCDSGEGNNVFAEGRIYADGSFDVIGWRNAASWRQRGEFPTRGVIAHRGDPTEFPENTIAAFQSAVRKGAEMVEFDEFRCRTGELVVMHDGEVDRTTNGKGKVGELSLVEIKAIDAGVRKDAKFIGMRVPTVEEAIACFPKSGVYLNIHCKTASAAPEVAALLRRTGRLAQGILMFDKRSEVVALKKKCPFARTGLVLYSDLDWRKPWTEDEAWRKLRDAVSLGVEFVQLLQNYHCTREQLAFLHEHGVRTTYCLANDEKTMTELVEEGYDFVFTDNLNRTRPAALAALKKAWPY